MRFAKLEVKAIIALILMRFDYTLENETGQPVGDEGGAALPPPFRDNLFQVPPVSKTCMCLSTSSDMMLCSEFNSFCNDRRKVCARFRLDVASRKS